MISRREKAPPETKRGDERWSRMLLNPADINFAIKMGAVGIRRDPNDFETKMFKRLPHRRHF